MEAPVGPSVWRLTRRLGPRRVARPTGPARVSLFPPRGVFFFRNVHVHVHVHVHVCYTKHHAGKRAKGLGWLGLTLARASENIQASFSWRKNRGL